MQIARFPVSGFDVFDSPGELSRAIVHAPRLENIFVGRSPNCIINSLGFANYEVSELPRIIKRSLNSGLLALSSALNPFMWDSRESHGTTGSEFYIFDYTSKDLRPESKGFQYGNDRGIALRISYGSMNKENGIHGWDPTEIARFHINAYGFREFKPKEGELEDSRNCLKEEVYFSLRWKKEGTDWIYNNPYPNLDSYETRTPWMRTIERGTLNLII